MIGAFKIMRVALFIDDGHCPFDYGAFQSLFDDFSATPAMLPFFPLER